MRLTFYVDVDCVIRGLMFYRDRADPANHIGMLVKRATAGNRDCQRAVAFYRNAALTGLVGWQTKYLTDPLSIPANEWWDYVLFYTGGIEYYTAGLVAATDLVVGHIHVPKDSSVDPFGVTVRNGAVQNPATSFSPNVAIGGGMPALDLLITT